jgi:hypothetical protein
VHQCFCPHSLLLRMKQPVKIQTSNMNSNMWILNMYKTFSATDFSLTSSALLLHYCKSQHSLQFFYRCTDLLLLWEENFHITWQLCGTLKILCIVYNKNIWNENLKHSSCTATIQCVREHFSYCMGTHLCTLEGTLVTVHANGPSSQTPNFG